MPYIVTIKRIVAESGLEELISERAYPDLDVKAALRAIEDTPPPPVKRRHTRREKS